MSAGLMHRVVILASFIIAVVTFFFNLNTGCDILYAAFWALCVLFGVSIVMLVALQSVAKALLRHLQERQRQQHDAEMEALRKQIAKQQKDQGG